MSFDPVCRHHVSPEDCTNPECREIADLQIELSDIATQKTMLVGMVAELATSLRSCEKQLVTCAHAYRAADNFDEAQRCSDIAFTARLILQKWEEA